MKYLTDSEILSWNKKMSYKGITCGVVTDQTTGEPAICLMSNSNSVDRLALSNFLKNYIDDISIKYKFRFSIATNRVDCFFDILTALEKDSLGTKFRNKDNSFTFIDLDKLEKSVDKTTHQIYNKEYTLFNYDFTGNFSAIVAYTSYIEDAINFFNKIWGYEEDGTEKNLLMFNIGDVVSPIDDKSTDYLILNYVYDKAYNEYHIKYISAELLSDGAKPGIKYGKIRVYEDKDICYSRNSRIDNILGK